MKRLDDLKRRSQDLIARNRLLDMETIKKQLTNTNEAIMLHVIKANRNYNDGSGSSKEQMRPKMSADLAMHKAF